MESKENTQPWYLKVDGEKVTVSKEVYQLIRCENNRIRYCARKEGRCAQIDYMYCRGNCSTCRWQINGSLISASEEDWKRNQVFISPLMVENETISKITMEKVYKEADQLVPDGSTVLRMYFQDGFTTREIADTLGISQTTAIRQKQKLLNYIRDHFEVFF